MYIRVLLILAFVILWSTQALCAQDEQSKSKGTICLAEGPYEALGDFPKLNKKHIIEEAKSAAKVLHYDFKLMENWNCESAQMYDSSCLKKSDQCTVSLYFAFAEVKEGYQYAIVSSNLESTYKSKQLFKEPLNDGNVWSKIQYGVKHAIARSSETVKHILDYEQGRPNRVLKVKTNLLDDPTDKQNQLKLQAQYKRLKTAALIMGGLTVGVAALSGGLYIGANSKYNTEKEKARIDVDNQALDTTKNLLRASAISGVAAGALGVTTVVLTVLCLKKKKELSLIATPSVTHNGGMFVLGGTF